MSGESTFQVRAIYAFKGSNNDELNFKKNDLITVTQVVEGGWWEGTLGGKTGWFPSNYVKECKLQDSLPGTNGDRNSNKIPEVVTSNCNSRAENLKVHRETVLKDMIESEKAHTTEMSNLVKNYLAPLQQSDILGKSDYQQLTGNLQEVMDCHQALLTLLENCKEQSASQQRIGGEFMQLAPQYKTVHMRYCANHPYAVTILEKYRTELDDFMNSRGVGSQQGIMVLTSGLSSPFRRLDKYSGILQELERHVEENHPDRGDAQRAVSVYREISAACSSVRKQKEMEVEVLCGNIKNWEGDAIDTLGEILHMSLVGVCVAGGERRDRYFVLFPSCLVMLSVSPCMSSFVYEGKLPLSLLVVTRVNGSSIRHGFEISGVNDKITVACHSQDDLEKWLSLIKQQIQNNLSRSQASPQPPVDASTPGPPEPYSLLSASSQSLPLLPKFCPSRHGQPDRKLWTLSCLRPSPPMRPSCLASPRRKQQAPEHTGGSLHRKKDIDHSQQHAFEEDVLLLQVIEAYCTSNKNRYTINSALINTPQVIIAEEEKIIVEERTRNGTIVQERSLVDTVYALRDQILSLEQETTSLSRCLEEEKTARKKLENVLRKHLGNSNRESEVSSAWDLEQQS